jgi:hypothetical protein
MIPLIYAKKRCIGFLQLLNLSARKYNDKVSLKMKMQIIRSTIFLLFAVIGLNFAKTDKAPEATVQFSIFHSNDFMGYLTPCG